MRLIKRIGHYLRLRSEEETEEASFQSPREHPEHQHPGRISLFDQKRHADERTSELGVVRRLPRLRDVPREEQQDLFRKKIALCCEVFDFRDDSHMLEKEMKHQILMELVDHVNITRDCFSEDLVAPIVEMIGLNIFRAMRSRDPEDRNRKPLGMADEEPISTGPFEEISPSWPHQQIVYEFFLRFVSSDQISQKNVAPFIDESFIAQFLDLFDSEHVRERDYLKKILHRIYGKFMVFRRFIRQRIQDMLVRVILKSQDLRGISELLEVLGNIINGFSLPLKDEHKAFLFTTLVPLLKVPFVPSFGTPLSYCVVQFVEKDPQLACGVITTMLRFWPVTNTAKQILFLRVFEETLEFTEMPDFYQVQAPLFRRLVLCIVSQHFQVAERALLYWNNQYIVNLINHNRATIFPVVIGGLLENAAGHWHPKISELASSVLALVQEVDPQLFDSCCARHAMDKEAGERRKKLRKEKWKRVRDLHDANVFGNRRK